MKYGLMGFGAGTFLLAAAGVGAAQTTIIETTGAAPPDEVVTYVERERVPSVRVDGEVRIGYAIPDTVQIRTIPRYQQYGYAVVNERRIIVEPGTRKVVLILD